MGNKEIIEAVSMFYSVYLEFLQEMRRSEYCNSADMCIVRCESA